MTIIPENDTNQKLAAALLSKAIAGHDVTDYANHLTQEWLELIEAVVAEPVTARRTQAFETAIHGRQDASEILAAVFAADPAADIGKLIPGPKTFADIESLLGPITWAWQPWLANGFVTILASESGTGKSALSLALCECFLTGKPWPDKARFTTNPGAVLWCEAEAAQAINLERAKKWGMDLKRIYTPMEPTEDFSLENDAHRAGLINLAHREDVQLIVIDSLSGADSKAEKGTEESMTIKWIAQLARDTNKPFLVTHHLRKRNLFDGDTISLDRLRGSSALVQTARLVWALDVPDPQNKDWKRLQVVKSNLAKFPEPLGVTITAEGVRYGIAPEEPKTEGVIDQAADLLLSLLQKAPRTATEIEDEFNQAGISRATMKRAKERLGVISRKDKTGWSWALPAKGQYDS